MTIDKDDFEFAIPDELLPWLESQRQNEMHCDLGYYILRNFKLVRVSMLEWAAWFNDLEARTVENTAVDDYYTSSSSPVVISTVFLGIDHNFSFDDLVHHRPILFESMIFGGHLDQFQWRYSTLGEAKQGHYELVEAVRTHRKPNMRIGQEGFWNLFREMFE